MSGVSRLVAPRPDPVGKMIAESADILAFLHLALGA
jgi:hypothetical protein